MHMGPIDRVCKLEDVVCCDVVPWSVVELCVDWGERTVAPNVVSMSCGSAEEFHQFKDTLLKNVPCVHLVPMRAEFLCHSDNEKFPCCVCVPRFDEVGQCAPIRHIDVVGECWNCSLMLETLHHVPCMAIPPLRSMRSSPLFVNMTRSKVQKLVFCLFVVWLTFSVVPFTIMFVSFVFLFVFFPSCTPSCVHGLRGSVLSANAWAHAAALPLALLSILGSSAFPEAHCSCEPSSPYVSSYVLFLFLSLCLLPFTCEPVGI